MSHAYCPECGFQNPEASNYCARCGAYLRRDELGETTLSLTPEEIDEGLARGELRGPALVVRAGGGRAGESFELAGLRIAMAIRQYFMPICALPDTPATTNARQ